ncbi:MAG: hypothetical protein P5702_10695 [Limnospira sp. PMC 1291.21]|uniref:Uncharacterized protein n=2 Tax=Limnospira TaxID=2596745 RepID=A0A9P1KDN0_9CYAN|nr:MULTISPECIES: hypothetical protein [Limnospira]EKD10896.1 hypothetical protein SPLC1_S051040 [Arthrospira platensis C1]MDC0839276.1 hypothetical protein [Limnoraphis robusta]EDZ93647.1 hypothetical protein AmaxDRAFT_3579 [Limnospira maxima CS-328]MDT9180249.1 hypothetical protein [Limnospira sp. PMC 1238.20]MDT9193089.1 hypothetical protein [Limnospira sp. PMC 1245.20]
MKILIDTNVLVSAVLRDRIPEQVVLYVKDISGDLKTRFSKIPDQETGLCLSPTLPPNTPTIGAIAMMTKIQQTNKLLEQLETLTPEEINMVIAFADFLHYKKSIQSPKQVIQKHPGATTHFSPKNLSKLRGIAKPVSVLEQSDPQTDYVDYLTNKYT